MHNRDQLQKGRNLQDLLLDGTRYDPRYHPSRNADHMPMTLCAITGLGGDFDTMVAYRNEYRKILHEVQSSYSSRNWRSGIGKSGSYPSLFAWFSEQVTDKGIESTVSEYLPEFVSSLTLEAFHPIIRLGYAIDFESEAETAAALAYIVSSHQDVPVDMKKSVELQASKQRQVTVGSQR